MKTLVYIYLFGFPHYIQVININKHIFLHFGFGRIFFPLNWNSLSWIIHLYSTFSSKLLLFGKCRVYCRLLSSFFFYIENCRCSLQNEKISHSFNIKIMIESVKWIVLKISLKVFECKLDKDYLSAGLKKKNKKKTEFQICYEKYYYYKKKTSS